MALAVILIIDDEPKIRALLREALRGEAEQLFEASTGRAAIELAEAKCPDLLVLDLGLPDMEGIEVCRSIRAQSSAPILVLSARASEDEKAALLDAGADDYITKPFSVVEFQARVRAQARRSQMGPVSGTDTPLTIGELTIDTPRRRVIRAGAEVHLTPTEWGVLRVLVAHADRPVTHAQLFRSVWGSAAGDTQLYLRVYVAHLRRKLEVDPYQPRLILTEPGVGYRLVLVP